MPSCGWRWRAASRAWGGAAEADVLVESCQDRELYRRQGGEHTQEADGGKQRKEAGV